VCKRYLECIQGEALHAICNGIEDTSFVTSVISNGCSFGCESPYLLFMLCVFDNLHTNVSTNWKILLKRD